MIINYERDKNETENNKTCRNCKSVLKHYAIGKENRIIDKKRDAALILNVKYGKSEKLISTDSIASCGTVRNSNREKRQHCRKTLET